MSTFVLLSIAILAVLLLLFLVIKIKMSAFVALLLVSLITALCAGIPAENVMPTLITGMGGTLGSVAIIVGLGAILGKMIEESGGAEALANYFNQLLGVKKTVAALSIVGFILGIPIFVDVGFIILAPIVLGFARITKVHPVVYGIPVGIVMLIVHVIVPPHPGPVAAAGSLFADVGLLTLYGLIICVPTSIVGYLVARKIISSYLSKNSATSEDSEILLQEAPDLSQRTQENPPSVWLIVGLIVLPIALIMVGTVSKTILPSDHSLMGITQLIGAPGFALLLTLGIAFFTLGTMRGWSVSKIGSVMDSALPTAAVVIMVTGGGGVFGKVLSESGVGTALADTLNAVGIPILPAAFLIAATLRASQGSATVAILTTAGLLVNALDGVSDIYRVLVTIAIGFGSLGFSHINDSFFWILTRYLGISVADGLKTWTVISTITSISGFIFTYIAYLILV